MRLFVIEGMQNSMKLFYKKNERSRPSDMYFKMLYNEEIKYFKRAFGHFGCSIKFIKIRDSISEIMSQPNSFTKIPQNLLTVLNSFAEIRKLQRANLLKNFDLIPSADAMIEIEQKFGGSLTPEDMSGI